MSRGRRFRADLQAVRLLVAAGLAQLTPATGKDEAPRLESARARLRSADDELRRAVGGFSAVGATVLGGVIAFPAVWCAAVAARALGYAAAWVIVTAVIVLIAAVVGVHASGRPIARRINRRRMARAERDVRPFRVGVAGAAPLAEVPPALLRARSRLVSAALRRAGSDRSPYLLWLVDESWPMRHVAGADLLLCQAIDFLETDLDEGWAVS